MHRTNFCSFFLYTKVSKKFTTKHLCNEAWKTFFISLIHKSRYQQLNRQQHKEHNIPLRRIFEKFRWNKAQVFFIKPTTALARFGFKHSTEVDEGNKRINKNGPSFSIITTRHLIREKKLRLHAKRSLARMQKLARQVNLHESKTEL